MYIFCQLSYVLDKKSVIATTTIATTIVVAVIAFIIILVFIGIIFFCVSIKYIHYISALENCVDDSTTTYFITDLNGDNLINIEEIEQVTQRYSRETNQYEIVYYLKSLHSITETFDDGFECRERFRDISKILNDFNY